MRSDDSVVGTVSGHYSARAQSRSFAVGRSQDTARWPCQGLASFGLVRPLRHAFLPAQQSQPKNSRRPFARFRVQFNCPNNNSNSNCGGGGGELRTFAACRRARLSRQRPIGRRWFVYTRKLYAMAGLADVATVCCGVSSCCCCRWPATAICSPMLQAKFALNSNSSGSRTGPPIKV